MLCGCSHRWHRGGFPGSVLFGLCPHLQIGVWCSFWVVCNGSNRVGSGYLNRSNIFERVCELRINWLVICMVRVWDDGYMYLDKWCHILGWLTNILSRVLVSDIAC